MNDTPETIEETQPSDQEEVQTSAETPESLPETEEQTGNAETESHDEPVKAEEETVKTASKTNLLKGTLSRTPHAVGAALKALKVFFGIVHRFLVKLFANYTFRLTFVLFAIAMISALILGVVFNVTSPAIAEHKADTLREAMSAVMEADSFTKAETEIADKNVSAIYRARNGDRLVGYAVESSASGYGGNISIIVGVNLEGHITGVEVVSHSETPGLGSLAKDDPEFTAQFMGLGGGLTVGNEIDTMSGATITSKAVTQAVNSAVASVLAYQQQGD